MDASVTDQIVFICWTQAEQVVHLQSLSEMSTKSFCTLRAHGLSHFDRHCGVKFSANVTRWSVDAVHLLSCGFA